MQKLRKSLGDIYLASEEEALELQDKLESELYQKVNFQLKQGDLILGKFNRLPEDLCQDKSSNNRKIRNVSEFLNGRLIDYKLINFN